MSGAGTPVQAVIFGGTTEGRQLADFCGQRGIRCAVCVVSSYGEELLPETEWVRRETGARTAEEMAKLLGRLRPALVLDATHPYAVQASENIRLACEKTGIDCLRVVRQSEAAAGAAAEADAAETAGAAEAAEAARAAGAGGEETPRIRYVRDAAEAAEALAGTRGPVFVTTGSKELEAFARLENWQERIYVRVLPDSRVLAQCEAMGFARGHVIAMQGPFSADLNAAMMQAVQAAYLVTKESGAAGGFAEKMEAAARLGIPAVVIGRPRQESGISAEEACRRLARLGTEQKRQIFLTGIGMGGPEQRTLEAERVLRQAAAAAGAPRMLESAGELLKGKPVYAGYGSEGILDWFEKHPELASLAVVYSGDPGFYSGAEGFRQEAKRREAAGGEAFDVRTVAGVSSMAFLCARMGISWQQVYPASRHGREADAAALLRDHAQVFLLLEGGDGAAQVCRQLTEAGYGDARVTVGERLSYPEERVVTAAASQMGETRFDGLCAMLIRR